jgi:hypothetical protein
LSAPQRETFSNESSGFVIFDVRRYITESEEETKDLNPAPPRLMTLEKLYRAFVFLRGFARIERAEIATLVRLRIRFARVEPVLA